MLLFRGKAAGLLMRWVLLLLLPTFCDLAQPMDLTQSWAELPGRAMMVRGGGKRLLFERVVPGVLHPPKEYPILRGSDLENEAGPTADQGQAPKQTDQGISLSDRNEDSLGNPVGLAPSKPDIPSWVQFKPVPDKEGSPGDKKLDPTKGEDPEKDEEKDSFQMFVVKVNGKLREAARQTILKGYSPEYFKYVPHDSFVLSLTASAAEKLATEDSVQGLFVMPSSLKAPEALLDPDEWQSRVDAISKTEQGLDGRGKGSDYLNSTVILDMKLGIDFTSELSDFETEAWSTYSQYLQTVRMVTSTHMVLQVKIGGCLDVVKWLVNVPEAVWIDVRPTMYTRRPNRQLSLAAALGFHPEEAENSPSRNLSRADLYFRGQKSVRKKERSDFSDQIRLRNKHAQAIILGESADATSYLIYDKGLNGTGQIVGVADTGVDYDHCFFWDSSESMPECGNGVSCSASSINSNHRKVLSYRNLATAGVTNVAGDPNGHGTHVAGSIAGFDTNYAHADTRDSHGSAPGAKLAIDDFPTGSSGSGLYAPDDLYSGLFAFPYQIGAKIHSNSWGSNWNEYTERSVAADSFMWDNPDFLIMAAAGNDGPARQTTADFATAKNPIAVGASQNHAAAYPVFVTDVVLYIQQAPCCQGYELSILEAFFGPEINYPNLKSGQLAGASPEDACSTTASLSGKIALVKLSGACSEQQSAVNVQNAGAIAMIMIPPQATYYRMPSDPTTSSVTIPCVMISNHLGNGDVLWAWVTGGETVRVQVGVLLGYIPEPTGGSSQLASFSSKGPTIDMRYKPDIVAPGEAINSAESDFSLTSFQCDQSTSKFALTVQSGTSMATPLAAGAAAIVRQYFEEGFHATGAKDTANSIQPSAALVKAMLLQSGTLINYYSESSAVATPSTLPNFELGYGLINLKSVLWFGSESSFKLHVKDRDAVSNGEVLTYCLRVESGGSQLKATLAWTDSPGAEYAQFALINDLDLELVEIASKSFWYGNAKLAADAEAGSSAGPFARDMMNNNEQITHASAAAGDYVLRIRGTDVPEGPQPFSLVVTGNLAQVNTSCDYVGCPNDCSSNGVCESTGLCACYPTHYGLDCAVPATGLATGSSQSWSVQEDRWKYYSYCVDDSSEDWALEVTVSGLVGIYVAWNRPPTFHDWDVSPLYSFSEASVVTVQSPQSQTTSSFSISQTSLINSIEAGCGCFMVALYSFCCQEATGTLTANFVTAATDCNFAQTTTSTTVLPTTTSTTTPRHTTSSSTTEALTTSSTTTPAPTTSSSTTPAPPTSSSTTPMLTTSSSTTPAPTTSSSTTPAPTSSSSTTPAPTTSSSTTQAPTTSSSTTPAPTTSSSTTADPTTSSSTTPAPTTSSSTTQAPSTSSSTTPAPTTSSSTTQAPTTSSSTTPAPTTSSSTTQALTSSSTTPPPTTSSSTSQVATTSSSTTPAPTTSSSTTPDTTIFARTTSSSISATPTAEALTTTTAVRRPELATTPTVEQSPVRSFSSLANFASTSTPLVTSSQAIKLPTSHALDVDNPMSTLIQDASVVTSSAAAQVPNVETTINFLVPSTAAPSAIIAQVQTTAPLPDPVIAFAVRITMNETQFRQVEQEYKQGVADTAEVLVERVVVVSVKTVRRRGFGRRQVTSSVEVETNIRMEQQEVQTGQVATFTKKLTVEALSEVMISVGLPPVEFTQEPVLELPAIVAPTTTSQATSQIPVTSTTSLPVPVQEDVGQTRPLVIGIAIGGSSGFLALVCWCLRRRRKMAKLSSDQLVHPGPDTPITMTSRSGNSSPMRMNSENSSPMRVNSELSFSLRSPPRDTLLTRAGSFDPRTGSFNSLAWSEGSERNILSLQLEQPRKVTIDNAIHFTASRQHREGEERVGGPTAVKFSTADLLGQLEEMQVDQTTEPILGLPVSDSDDSFALERFQQMPGLPHDRFSSLPHSTDSAVLQNFHFSVIQDIDPRYYVAPQSMSLCETRVEKCKITKSLSSRKNADVKIEDVLEEQAEISQESSALLKPTEIFDVDPGESVQASNDVGFTSQINPGPQLPHAPFGSFQPPARKIAGTAS